MEFQSNIDLDLAFNSFKYAFICMSHFSINEPFGMVFKHLQDSFNLGDLANNFSKFFLVCSYIAIGCTPRNITCVLGTMQLLALAIALTTLGIRLCWPYLLSFHSCKIVTHFYWRVEEHVIQICFHFNHIWRWQKTFFPLELKLASLFWIVFK